jgi:pimeloyl-ACP methyl ester carboxylesterase
MDGVLGQPGYSFRQQAAFTHALLQSLHVNGPLIWVGVDTQGQVGMWYATDFVNDPLAITKMVMVNTAPNGIVSDNPCSLAILTTTQAESLVQAYTAAPYATACFLVSNSFITKNSPEATKIQEEAAAKFTAQMPANVFARLFLQVFLENVTSLMPDITIPVLTFLSNTGGINPIATRATGITLMPYCPACPNNNPVIPGNCPNGVSFIQPFPDSRLLVYPGHGTCVQVSAFERFKRDLEEFITGKDAEVTLCPTNFNSSNTCPGCS